MDNSEYEDLTKEELIQKVRDLSKEVSGLKKAFKNYYPEFKFNENYFSMLLDSMIIGVVVHNAKGEIIYCNRASQNILGLSYEQMIGVKDIDPSWKLVTQDGALLPPDMIPSQVTLNTGAEVHNFLLGVVKPDNSISWLSVTSKAICNYKNQVEFVLVSFYDISVLKEAKEELKRITNFLQTALNAVEMGIWSWDIRTNNIEWSDGVHRIFGLQEGKFLGSFDEYLALLAQESRSYVLQKIQEALQSEHGDYMVQHKLNRPNGEVIWVEAKGKVYKDTNGSPYKMIGTVMNITVQKKAEEEIKKSSFLIETAGKIAKLGGWELNLENLVMVWSDEVFSLFEIETSVKPTIRLIIKSFSKKDYLRLKEKLLTAIENQTSFDGEFEFTSTTNRVKWVRIIGLCEYSGEFWTKKIIGTIQDVTEKKLYEEALRQSEKRFEVFYDLASEGLCIFNKNFVILDTNTAFIELFKAERQRLENVLLSEFLSVESFLVLKKYIQSDEPIIKPVQLVGRKTDGTLFSIQCKFNLLYYKKGLVYIANFIDMTTEKEADRLRVINEEMLKKNELIQKQKDKLESTISDLNRTRDQLILSEKMASLGQLITGIAHELNNPIGAIRATSKNSEIIFKELLELLIDSSHLLVQLTPSEWQSILEFSNVSGRVSNFFHGSEARVIKRNLIEKLQSEKIENVEDIADSFVDVGISECPESIIEILKNRKDSYKLIITLAHFSKNQSTINFATERISKVIYSLKNFSRVNNSGEKVKTNLIENIETVLTLYQNQFRFDVNVVRTYNPIPEIYCYQEDLFHVWSNLIYNALQAMQFKGTLEIITDYLADFVRVTIKDNGAGIPVEVQEMIFKPFFTTKKSGEGTGLGLDIARRIVEKHSGQILFDSVPGETSFYIYLPLE